MISLRGKTALITGGSRGIGLAIARAFAFRGASTILVGRNADTLQSAVVSLRETTAGSAEMHQQLPTPLLPSPSSQTTQNFHTSVQGDVCLATTWQDLIRRLEEGDLGAGAGAGAAKRIDVLVNCAGIAQRSLLVKTSPEDVDALLDTNLKSAVLGCKYVGRQMLRSAASFSRSRTPPLSSSSPSSEEGSGNGERAGREEAGLSIINVSSVMASRGGHGASVYAASKAGILGRLFKAPIFASSTQGHLTQRRLQASRQP